MSIKLPRYQGRKCSVFILKHSSFLQVSVIVDFSVALWQVVRYLPRNLDIVE